MKRLPWAACVLVSSLAGCGSPPQPQPASSSQASSAAAATPAASALSTGTGVFEATILTVAISMEDVKLRRVRIEFKNGTGRECKVTGYTVEWPGGKKPARPDVVVPAGQSRDRWLRVDTLDGDIGSLTADVAKVTLQSDCPVKGP